MKLEKRLNHQFKLNTKGKFPFLILSTVSLVLLMFLTTVVWWFISPRLHEISSFIAVFSLTVLRLFYISVILGIIAIYLSCYWNFSISVFNKFIRFSITILFPVNVLLGKLLGISKDYIRTSFVSVNNSFLNIKKHKFHSKDILILLPHCIQNFDCNYRITNNINNCVECGKCKIMNLKHLANKYHVNIAIATGGTLARKIIVQTRPKCIIAVACQRDLVDGLLEVFPIPVYGVLNERPFGPCVNTTVNVNLIEDFLKNFIMEEK